MEVHKLLPDDLTSYIWGAASVAVAWFLSSLTKAAGKDAWSWLKNKINPAPPEPIKVDGKFVPEAYEPGSCAWVREEKVYDYEDKGYFYYPHPKNGAKCFRETYSGQIKYVEWLMVKPDVKQIVT